MTDAQFPQVRRFLTAIEMADGRIVVIRGGPHRDVVLDQRQVDDDPGRDFTGPETLTSDTWTWEQTRIVFSRPLGHRAPFVTTTVEDRWPELGASGAGVAPADEPGPYGCAGGRGSCCQDPRPGPSAPST